MQAQVEESPNDYFVVKRKTQICYYVMKLAQYGDVFSFIEQTDRFEESTTRYIMD